MTDKKWNVFDIDLSTGHCNYDNVTIFEAITDAALIEHNNLYMKVIQIEAYEELQKKLEIALKTLNLIALNKTEDCDIYTMGCDCDLEAKQAIKEIEGINEPS